MRIDTFQKGHTFKNFAEMLIFQNYIIFQFFQSNWNVVGEDLISEVKKFFKSGCMPKTVNETHIRLIPKITGPKQVADYRPIALCNVYYKVISKLLARRLQPNLEDLISKNQSTFVPKRAISNNV